MSNNKQIFFQSSLPRSGSTLLQNIIGQNPNFYVTSTSGVLELVFASRHNSVYGQFGDHKIKTKVEPPSEDYNEVLGQQLADNIKQSYQWFYDYFNY